MLGSPEDDKQPRAGAPKRGPSLGDASAGVAPAGESPGAETTDNASIIAIPIDPDDDSEIPAELVSETSHDSAEVPAGQQRRRGSYSIPPPIPAAARRKPATGGQPPRDSAFGGPEMERAGERRRAGLKTERASERWRAGPDAELEIARITTPVIANTPDSPTVVELALATLAETSHRTRAEQIALEVERTAGVDAPAAANLAYELGELCERRLGDDARAIQAYGRALELDASLLPASWALRRMLYRSGQWPDLLRLIGAELGAATSDHERVELLLERAVVSGHHESDDDQPRISLEVALRLAPRNQGALLELERVVARAGDLSALLDVWERLADAIDHPERKIAYWLLVARQAAASDGGRAQSALDEAAQIAVTAPPALLPRAVVERIARERLRIADEHGTPAQVAAGIEGLVKALSEPTGAPDPADERTRLLADEHPNRAVVRQRELVALLRRQAQLVSVEMPARAWAYLQQALAVMPEEPVVLVDLIGIAGELGHHDALPQLVQTWQAVEGDAGRAQLLSSWCAEAHEDGAGDGASERPLASGTRRERRRALLMSLEATAPGFVLLTSTAECDALADPTRARSQLALANAYLAAGRAAALGTWLGPGPPPRPDTNAAIALDVQAAHVLAYYVATPAALEHARDVLVKALVAVPEHPAVLEALIDLDDTTGHATEALTRLRAQASATPDDRAIVERAIRLAYTHRLPEVQLELERELARRDPTNFALSWRVESTLAQLGRDDERLELLDRLAEQDPDHGRRRTALLGAARLQQRAGATAGATNRYRQMLALWPEDAFAREALIELLRSQQRWAELADERRAEARATSDGPLARRALREAAWVLEICLDEAAQATTVYEEWLTRLPGDRTALEGIARCHVTLGDHAGEVTARAAIALVDETSDTRWLYARSLERAARYDEAAEQYRGLVEREESGEALAEDSLVAATSATLALGDLAARGADIEMRIEAAEALATRTTDPRLGAALFEDSGWMHVIAREDFESAALSFVAALELEPARQGALLGAALVAACQADLAGVGIAYMQLASTVQMPEAAAALFLRAAAVAAANGDVDVANERIEAAQTADPDNMNALFLVAEIAAALPVDAADPFAAVDLLLSRAEILKRRGELTDDQVSRIPWELDRADALELAGQLREAGTVIASVLQIAPDDRRAMWALRRVAQRAGIKLTSAQASYALAQLSHDAGSKLRMLREALEVYDRPGPADNIDYTLAIYRRIVAIDPGASEGERLIEMLRQRGDARVLIAALTERLTWLAIDRVEHERQMIALLLERSTLLRSLGERDRAACDLEAILDHAPGHVEALLLRAEISSDAGDVDQAVALWSRYLEVETTGSRRLEVERRLAQALEHDDDLAPPPANRMASVSEEQTTDVVADELTGEIWDSEPTDAESLIQPAELYGARLVHRSTENNATVRPGPEMERASERWRAGHVRRASTPGSTRPGASQKGARIRKEPEFFGRQTVLADLSELQEQERQQAKVSRAPADDLEVTDAVNLPADLASSVVFSPPIATRVVAGMMPPPSSATPALAMPTVTVTAASSFERASPDAPVSSVPSDGTLRPPHLDLVELFRSIDPPRAPPNDTVELEPSLDLDPIPFPEQRQISLDDSEVVMLSYAQLQPVRLGAALAEMLLHYERELVAAKDGASLVPLRIEAGRLTERLGELERARIHYETALLASPRSLTAMRGLRRIARSNGDLVEVTRLLDAELALVTGREREVLLRYRLDLLLATGEQDVARVAVGELLDGSPSDIPALLAHLELAFLDDRKDEFGGALERLAEAVTDPALRSSVQSARAVLAARQGDNAAAATWFAAAAQADPGSPATRLGAIRHAAAHGQGAAAGLALLDLACHVEGEDPITAAALAVRAQLWTAGSLTAERSRVDRLLPTAHQPSTPDGGSPRGELESGHETIAAAAQLASRAAPRDALVARIAAETAVLAGDRTIASHAFARWARCKSAPVERAYAAARAAELEPARLGRLWAQALELDPGDDHAAARLRALHIGAEETRLAIELDLQTAADTHRDLPLLRAASELVDDDRPDVAIELLGRVREQRPDSLLVGEGLAEALARAGRWTERAKLLGEMVPGPRSEDTPTAGKPARDLARWRTALAWETAARAAAAGSGAHARDELAQVTVAALDAWDLVLADDPRAMVAHAAAIGLASHLDNAGILMDALARAQAAEGSPWAASSLALRRARLLSRSDPRLAQDVANDGAPELDDPRRTLVVMMAAAQRQDLGEAATALEERATRVESSAPAGEPTSEPATLRLRAAQLALDANDVTRASALLAQVHQAVPGLVDDLIDVARRRIQRASTSAGSPVQPSPDAPALTGGESFVCRLRDAELAATRTDRARAVKAYHRALEIRPTDPLAAGPLVRIATELGDPGPIAALALEQVRSAEAVDDPIGKACGYELMAAAEQLRGDPASVHRALESASQADPTRMDLLHRLEREPAASARYGELLHLREREVDRVKRSLAAVPASSWPGGLHDLGALIMDAATLAIRDNRIAAKLAVLYRAALDANPRSRAALLQLESIVRRGGFSMELAALQQHVAASCDDLRSKAAFLTRAGETLAALGRPAEAIDQFAEAADTLPAYAAALEAWHQTALANRLWFQLAEVATRRSKLEHEPKKIAALHHFAGVALMDKARAAEPAIVAFGRALQSDPRHADAALRLQSLLENRHKLASLPRP